MTRRSEFVATLRMLVQTWTRMRGSIGAAFQSELSRCVEELELAAMLPEEAIPLPVHFAALAFFRWRFYGEAKPAWLAEWEENQRRVW